MKCGDHGTTPDFFKSDRMLPRHSRRLTAALVDVTASVLRSAALRWSRALPQGTVDAARKKQTHLIIAERIHI
jgi:hypothetical protein